MTRNAKKYLTAFLNLSNPYMIGCERNGKNRTSCLVITYKAARLLSGREMESGEFRNESIGLAPVRWDEKESPYFLSRHSFPGVLNYLIALEIIGSVFKKKHTNRQRLNGIFNAINDFSNCTELIEFPRKINAIVALRNALAHNSGLAAPARKNKKNPHFTPESFKFTLNHRMGEEDNVVILPERKWRRNAFSDKESNSTTTINSQRIGSLAESILKNVTKELQENKLELALKHGLNEFKSKYTLL